MLAHHSTRTRRHRPPRPSVDDRRHRRTESTLAYDRAMAATGFAYAVAIYLGLVISAPPEMRSAPSGATAPVVEFLYGLPQLAGLVPLGLAVALMYLVHRRHRGAGAES